MTVEWPTPDDLQAARTAFESSEPRDLFYRAATDLVDAAIRRATSLSIAEALAVLLQTWNSAFYRYRRFDAKHFSDIERLLESNLETALRVRHRSIESLRPDDEDDVRDLFRAFERVLGPVGAAKCLHLLAPRFFPLWDRAIAANYGCALGPAGTNDDAYWRFMATARRQCNTLGGEAAIGRNPLKAVDEYNYCRYTKGWI